jgi:hypothetical protein
MKCAKDLEETTTARDAQAEHRTRVVHNIREAPY